MPAWIVEQVLVPFACRRSKDFAPGTGKDVVPCPEYLLLINSNIRNQQKCKHQTIQANLEKDQLPGAFQLNTTCGNNDFVNIDTFWEFCACLVISLPA